jgi:hypothetical protein
MTVKHGCGLIAALTFLAALSFPGSATAQSYQWNGVESYSYWQVNANTGQTIEEYGGNNVLSSLSVDFIDVNEPFFASVNISIGGFELSGPPNSDPIGAYGIDVSIEQTYPEGFAFASVSADLQGDAVANYYESFYDFDSNSYITESGSFQTVPEPSTLTLAAIGGIAICIFMRARRSLAPRKLRPGL